MQTQDSQIVAQRFYTALRMLISRRALRGVQTFTDRYGINRWNLLTTEKNLVSDMFQVAWMTYLVRDFGVSAEWLLTGVGEPLPPVEEVPARPKRPRGRPRKE